MFNVIYENMRINKLYLGLVTVVAAWGLTGCTADESDGMMNVGDDAISLVSSMGTTRSVSELQTNAVNTGVIVGVFGVAGTANVTNGNNNQYDVQTSGALKSRGKEMKWPKNTTNKVDIYAYAPYNKDWTYNAANSFSVSTDQSTDAGYLKSDLLHASAKQLAQTKTAIPLTFTHKLARLCITLNRASNAIYDLSKSTVYITNTKTATTLNPSTGELGAASGDAKSIQAATDINIGTATKVYAVVVPQKLANGTKLVRVKTTDGKYLTAKLGSDITFEAGKTYNFTASLAGVELTELTLGSITLTGWGDPNDLGSATAKKAFVVGDYVLKDGTFLKTTDEDFASKKTNIAGVIFSTTVSVTDAAAGYDAYAMGLTRVKDRTWGFSAQVTAGPTSLAEGLADLDGLSKTNAVVASDAYTTYISSHTDHVANLGDYTPALTGTNMSGWFVPSFGQMVQILNNLGGANISTSTMTTNTFTTDQSFYKYSNDNSESKVAPSTIIANIANYVVGQAGKLESVLVAGNITVATISESGTAEANEKFWTFNLNESGANWELGAAAGKTGTGRSVIPCLAVKFPTE